MTLETVRKKCWGGEAWYLLPDAARALDIAEGKALRLLKRYGGLLLVANRSRVCPMRVK